MNIKLTLRLILAITFATLAVIFSELLPPLEGVDSVVLRILVTILAALVGFLIFPDIASSVTILTIHSFNYIINKLVSEIVAQILRFTTHPQDLSSQTFQKSIILDTSSIIDGRILDIAKTGFIYGVVIIPQFVLTELQQVADSSDALKRARGRKGFELIEDLKNIKHIQVKIWERQVEGKQVDDKVLQLAKDLRGRIMTADYNLNKLASVSGIVVLNINDLANSLRPLVIPGEKIKVLLAHPGKDLSQGVGYLDDGTMVVVSDAAGLIGKTSRVEVTKNLQSPAGRMIFAKPI